jgi:hypothetical protein
MIVPFDFSLLIVHVFYYQGTKKGWKIPLP